MDPQVPQETVKFIYKHWMLSAFLGAVALIAIVSGAYYYNQYQNAASLLKNPNLAVEKQTKTLTDQVGKLMMLPTDETPTVATVTDASRLKNQPFFKNAKNGDKVLIYVNAKKAILFDPSANKIVDVAPVNISNNQAAVAPSGGASPTPTLVPVYPTRVVSPAPTQ